MENILSAKSTSWNDAIIITAINSSSEMRLLQTGEYTSITSDFNRYELLDREKISRLTDTMGLETRMK